MGDTKPFFMASLNTKQINELRTKYLAKSNLSVSAELRDFFDLFLVCEATARKIIEYYRNQKKPKNTTENYTITQIRSAVKHFNLYVVDSTIEHIFKAGKGKLGHKTCRQLRNSYIHNVPKGKEEIELRFKELKDYMEQWIYIFS